MRIGTKTDVKSDIFAVFESSVLLPQSDKSDAELHLLTNPSIDSWFLTISSGFNNWSRFLYFKYKIFYETDINNHGKS